MKSLLFGFGVLVLVFLAACAKTNPTIEPRAECQAPSDCGSQGACADGYKYERFACNNGNCSEINYFADPCLRHDNSGVECVQDSDCAVGGCSSQICGVKGQVEEIITTCEYRSEYVCLELTSCGCVDDRCGWKENDKYNACLARVQTYNEGNGTIQLIETQEPNPPQIKEFNIDAKSWEFDPSEIRVKEGDTVRLKIKSLDVPHGFKLKEFGVDERLDPRQEVTIEFVANKTCEFGFSCNVPCGAGHKDMKGVLIVE